MDSRICNPSAGSSSSTTQPPGAAGPMPMPGHDAPFQPPQLALLDFFFPGFSVFTGAVQRYLKIDLNVYIPMLILLGAGTFAWSYLSAFLWAQLEAHFMSTVDIRTDDEIYNMLMGWVARQSFAQRARRFVVNTNLNSRSWFLWSSWGDDEDDEGEDDGGEGAGDEQVAAAAEDHPAGGEESNEARRKKKLLSYTPTFGKHYFFYKRRLLIFTRSQNREQGSFLIASQREEISVSCFGRNPQVLKELLLEARSRFMKQDQHKTLIYRGSTGSAMSGSEPSWQRCMARTSRPFSTVILNEGVKKDLIDDVTDYLNPATRRWYANRGIPYRRGYLLHGPPGTGKSSLSLALAGFFRMRIYIVSLSAPSSNEENLASLFAELPRRCVVLLEDIDSAGLTHTRDDNKAQDQGDSGGGGSGDGGNKVKLRKQLVPTTPITPPGRLSLSGLLNILDGVASQEGRVLIMTTNHVEKLDKALIRPGRVDMIVKFDLADRGMTAAIFRAIYAPLEGDEDLPSMDGSAESPEAFQKRLAAEKAERDETRAKVERLAEEFSAKIPEHEFSPAELQGFLLKNKRDPAAAVAGAEQWMVDTRKEKKEKELQEAEEKRLAEEEEKKAEKKAEAKKKRKEAKRKAKSKKGRQSKSKRESESESESKSKSEAGSDSESDSSESSSSESEADDEPEKTPESEVETAASKDEVADKAGETTDQKATSAVEEKETQDCEGRRPRTRGTDSGYGTP